MGLFSFRLEHADGSPADPPRIESAMSMWHPGDTIPLGSRPALRVIELRARPPLLRGWRAVSPACCPRCCPRAAPVRKIPAYSV